MIPQNQSTKETATFAIVWELGDQEACPDLALQDHTTFYFEDQEVPHSPPQNLAPEPCYPTIIYTNKMGVLCVYFPT